MPQIYGDGTNSTVGKQLTTFFYQRKALIEAKKETFFGQLADVTSMPKNFGKTIKRYHYIPLLDAANINDQGIDANGATLMKTISIPVTTSDGTIPEIPPYYGRTVANAVYFVGESTSASTTDAAAITEASTNVMLAIINWATADTAGGGLGLTLTQTTTSLKFAEIVNSTNGKAYVLGFRFDGIENNSDLAALAVASGGNLYGSSKDIGTISGKMPALSETGGRVNRVGFRRVELEGTLEKFGFFDEYTQESLDFDSDAELEMHINREMINAANEITEDLLQIDLLTNAGVVRYPGTATSLATLDGDTDAVTVVTYDDLSRLSIDLDNNRCPKHTKIITGTRLVDTKVIPAARIMYIGSELQRTVERMTDPFGNQAFIPLAHYASAASEINGEIGTVGHFRICVVPEMMHHAGVGVAEGVNDGYRVTDGKYDAYPMLVVGDESFTQIGFQTSGKSVKFKIYHKKPGEDIASLDDPYGENGFMSIKWYYGFMVLRPERLAVLWTVAAW